MTTSTSKLPCRHCDGISTHFPECVSVMLDAARAEVEELRAWQRDIADGTGYINYAEGQGGYEVAPAETILRAWRRLQAEQDNWSAGTFVGPCAHDRDPYTRCEDCEELSPREALIKTVAERQREACSKRVEAAGSGTLLSTSDSAFWSKLILEVALVTELKERNRDGDD